MSPPGTSATSHADPTMSAWEGQSRHTAKDRRRASLTRRRRRGASLSVRYSSWGGAFRRSRGDRVPHAVMVSHRVARVGVRRRPRPFLQHSAVPCLPVAFESIKHVLPPILQIGTLARVLNHVEQKFVPCDPQVLPVAVADSALRPGFVAPIELARMRRRAGKRWQQILTVGRIGRVGLRSADSEQRWHPVHRDHSLIGKRSRRNTAGPARYRWDANAAFEQLELHAGKRPYIREPLSAIVTREYYDCVCC